MSVFTLQPFLWLACKHGKHAECLGEHPANCRCPGVGHCTCECHAQKPAPVPQEVIAPRLKVTDTFAPSPVEVVPSFFEDAPSPNYVAPCEKCGKPIKKTGKRGRPPRYHPECK